VKSFKFKIFREHQVTAINGKMKTTSSEEGYVTAVKENGCKAKEKFEGEFLVNIPVDNLGNTEAQAAKMSSKDKQKEENKVKNSWTNLDEKQLATSFGTSA